MSDSARRCNEDGLGNGVPERFTGFPLGMVNATVLDPGALPLLPRERAEAGEPLTDRILRRGARVLRESRPEENLAPPMNWPGIPTVASEPELKFECPGEGFHPLEDPGVYGIA